MRDPVTLRRDGLDAADAVEVVAKSGAVLLVEPATLAPAAILAGRVSDYAALAYTVRDQLVRQHLPGGTPADMAAVARLAVLAIAHTHPDATPTDVDDWLGRGEDADGDAVVALAMAAAGMRSADPARAALRRRAVRLALAGLGDCPLTAHESAPLDDWTRNAGRAP